MRSMHLGRGTHVSLMLNDFLGKSVFLLEKGEWGSLHEFYFVVVYTRVQPTARKCVHGSEKKRKKTTEKQDKSKFDTRTGREKVEDAEMLHCSPSLQIRDNKNITKAFVLLTQKNEDMIFEITNATSAT